MVYSLKQSPGTRADIGNTVGSVSQLSATLMMPGGIVSPHSIVTLAGQVIVGGVVSFTTIVCTHVDTLPQKSATL
jgi:hypothetical protein